MADRLLLAELIPDSVHEAAHSFRIGSSTSQIPVPYQGSMVTHACVCMYVCMYACMYVCMYIYICMYLCMYVSMYMYIYMYMSCKMVVSCKPL